MGKITLDQSHQILAVLATNTAWEEIDFEKAKLQDLVIRDSKEAGRRFTAYLKNGGRMTFGSPIICIDRTTPFDPTDCMGKGWTIEEQDERSLALTEIDLSKVYFKHMLGSYENSINGEERFKRLKSAGYIRLDAKVSQTLWKNPALIPELWKKYTNYMYFDGTILRDPDGDSLVLCLVLRDGRWCWSHRWLMADFSASDPSVVLASV